jgi:hypothetical protein
MTGILEVEVGHEGVHLAAPQNIVDTSEPSEGNSLAIRPGYKASLYSPTTQ